MQRPDSYTSSDTAYTQIMSALDAAVSSEPPSERPRLKLAPRSAAAASSGPAKSSIFGGARTREEILAAKGVDVKKKEAELDAKARPKRLTKQQAEELAAAEAEIKFEQEPRSSRPKI